MTEQSTGTAPARSGEGLRIVGFQEIFSHEDELRGQIAQRAYELFESRGRTPGKEGDDWLRAELEIRRLIRPEMTEGQDSITIRAELPGFSAQQLYVALEPGRVAISGKRQVSRTGKTAGTSTTEKGWEHVFHLMELPAEIDPAQTTATFYGYRLELFLAKAGSRQRGGTATRVA